MNKIVIYALLILLTLFFVFFSISSWHLSIERKKLQSKEKELQKQQEEIKKAYENDINEKLKRASGIGGGSTADMVNRSVDILRELSERH